MNRKKSYDVGAATRMTSTLTSTKERQALSPYADFERSAISRTDVKLSQELDLVQVKKPQLKSELRNPKKFNQDGPEQVISTLDDSNWSSFKFLLINIIDFKLKYKFKICNHYFIIFALTMSKKEDDENSSLFPCDTEQDTSEFDESSPLYRRPKRSVKEECSPETMKEIESEMK
jgi:hypothetical protein